MKRADFISLFLGLSLCLGAAAGLAESPPPGPRMGRGGPGPHGPGPQGRGLPFLIEALELDEDQQTRIKAIHRETRKKQIQKEADIGTAAVDLQALMDEDQPDRKKIHAQIKKIANFRAELEILEVDQRLDVQQVLTPEQLEKFRKQPMRRHRQRHREPGACPWCPAKPGPK